MAKTAQKCGHVAHCGGRFFYSFHYPHFAANTIRKNAVGQCVRGRVDAIVSPMLAIYVRLFAAHGHHSGTGTLMQPGSISKAVNALVEPGVHKTLRHRIYRVENQIVSIPLRRE